MKVVAFDTETKGFSWWTPDEQAFIATWADAEGQYCADLSDPAQVRRFTAALDAADVIVGHNLKFDLHQTLHTIGYDALEGREFHDTELMSRVLYPEGANKNGAGHGLKPLAKVWLRADADAPEEHITAMAKEIGLRTIKQTGAYYDVWRAYPSVMEEYARQDARYTFDLYQKFSSSMRDMRRVYELDRQAAVILYHAEERGVATDQTECAKLKAQFAEERDEAQAYLANELGDEALGGKGSDDALREALLKIGVPLHRKTETGILSTNKFALNEFRHDFPQIAVLEEWRTLNRFLTTYIGAIEGRDVIHPNFQPTGAWTGRMSCRQPNMQNWPKRAGKEVRAVLVPRPDHAFVVSDYEAIEIRLLAHYLNDAGFRELITTGMDPHAWMATNIWGGEMSQYIKGSPNEDRRKLAKNILFAITYGAGAPRVADMLRDAGQPGTKDEAKAIISAIKGNLPGYFRLMKRVRNKIENLGYVNTIWGRKQVVNRDKSYVGLNALIQGSAADIMKQGLMNVDKAVRPLGGIPLLVVHDEVVVEVPIARAAECQSVVDTALRAAYPLDPPLSTESSVVTTSYADA